MSQSPRKNHRKYRDVALLYDTDFNEQELIKIRLTIWDRNNILTPVTPLYEARFRDDYSNPIPARRFDPRRLGTCRIDGNREVRRTVYLPYNPTNPNLSAQIRETLTLVDSATYSGEGLIQQEEEE
jgi:hypothetical protein